MFSKNLRLRVQLEDDFVDVKDNVFNFGTVGLSDAAHRFWPLAAVFVQSRTESAENATVLLQAAIDFFVDIGKWHMLELNLMDGSFALTNAAKACKLLERLCYSHRTRKGLTRGGSYRGGKGSVWRYLGTSRKLPAKQISKVSAVP